MNKYTLFCLLLTIKTLSCFSQTAVDFTANDCAGNPHHLFAELDAGKVIVVSFVMPCGSCIAPSLSAQSMVQEYAVTNPGTVLFYISDDAANTPCATLSSWATTNGMGSAPDFSDLTFRESDYGVIAMPKIVVLGGANHHVFFNHNGGSLDTTLLKNAINSALATTAVPQINNAGFNLSLFPNPAKDQISLSYSLPQSLDVSIDIYNIIGSRIVSVFNEKQSSGKHELLINFTNKISNGIYYLKIKAGESTESFKFVVDK